MMALSYSCDIPTCNSWELGSRFCEENGDQCAYDDDFAEQYPAACGACNTGVNLCEAIGCTETNQGNCDGTPYPLFDEWGNQLPDDMLGISAHSTMGPGQSTAACSEFAVSAGSSVAEIAEARDGCRQENGTFFAIYI